MQSFSILAVLTAVFVASVYSVTSPVVHTDVTKYYDDSKELTKVPTEGAAYYGQDAHYVKNSPSYKNNNDGSITDLVTGLQWQQSAGSKMTYDQAVQAVSNYRVGGYSDWRIPTIKELYSLILFSGDVWGEKAGTKRFIDTNYFTQPIGNTTAGEREIDAQTMSYTEYKGVVFGKEKCVFGVNFVDGRIKCYPKRSSMYFRFVRGNTKYGINIYEDNRDGTVTDESTGLMWQQADSGRGMEWRDALAYCQDLILGGHSDWRLPSIKELQGLVDYTKTPQIDGNAAIDSLFSVTKITSPNGQLDYPFFWSATTHKDGPKSDMGAYIAFGQAWGSPYGEVLDVHGAGAQRSDPKSAGTASYPSYFGPQKDLRVVFNYARCVRYV